MSVEMKLGRWQARGGDVFTVSVHTPPDVFQWRADDGMCWMVDGSYWDDGKQSRFDLVRYLGPLELSPTPACADQAGTPVVSPVSTETAGEQLRRVNARLSAIRSELGIFRAQVRDMERTESDLEELAKRLEREVEVVNSSSSEASACAVIQDGRRGES